MKPQLIIDSNSVVCFAPVERKATKAGLTVARQALVVGDYLGGACVEAKSMAICFNQATVDTCGDNWTTWMPTTSVSSSLFTVT